MRSAIAPALTASVLLLPALAAAQPVPRAVANDQRQPAGRMLGGELRVDLEAVETAWHPHGPDGPRILTPAFAEVGESPRVPGPLIRAAAGTPIRVTIRNTLARPIAVRGLLDRASMASAGPPPGARSLPAFAFAEPTVIPPGETRETRFTPTAEVSSFYYGLALPPGAGAEAAPPFGSLEEGAFMGALVIDPAEAAPPEGERVLMITRWASIDDQSSAVSWKLMLNGQSWPFTERLEYTVGDTVRWRVINASALDHPMHLHGFYFTVDGTGDTQADVVHAPGERPQVVTHLMEEFSSMRLAWVPERPGNWLFHCHLIRHMGSSQQMAGNGARSDPPGHDHGAEHSMDAMAGLITGIHVLAGPGGEAPDEEPARRIDLWTAERPDVYHGHPELAFVVQQGSAPPPDSTRVPGSPIVLTRGEPTEIVVHNRFSFPLSVHWHGLELRSLYDGVGGWSGSPGSVRPPIAPGDSARVLIVPPRAGTFMYHVHGEAGHELSQGLYGPFLVLEPGESLDPAADRLFLLAARGARRDPAPAINGRTLPHPERFAPGRTYRLRFLHISADAYKRVRLLKDGEPVDWRPLAKDGADLPEPLRVPGPARVGIGVGETFDAAWTPPESGLYVLEVTTEFYPGRGGSVTQRVPFAVGEVPDSALELPQGADLSIVPLSAEERARYTGTFVGRSPAGANDPLELILAVWEQGGQLYTTGVLPRSWDDAGEPDRLFALGGHTFAPGRNLDGLLHLAGARYRFVEEEGVLQRIEVEIDGRVVLELTRVAELERTEDELRRFVGSYGPAGSAGSVTATMEGGVLMLVGADGRADRLIPISSTRFRLQNRPEWRADFEVDSGEVTAIVLLGPDGTRTRLELGAEQPAGEIE